MVRIEQVQITSPSGVQSKFTVRIRRLASLACLGDVWNQTNHLHRFTSIPHKTIQKGRNGYRQKLVWFRLARCRVDSLQVLLRIPFCLNWTNQLIDSFSLCTPSTHQIWRNPICCLDHPYLDQMFALRVRCGHVFLNKQPTPKQSSPVTRLITLFTSICPNFFRNYFEDIQV